MELVGGWAGWRNGRALSAGDWVAAVDPLVAASLSSETAGVFSDFSDLLLQIWGCGADGEFASVGVVSTGDLEGTCGLASCLDGGGGGRSCIPRGGSGLLGLRDMSASMVKGESGARSSSLFSSLPSPRWSGDAPMYDVLVLVVPSDDRSIDSPEERE